MAKKKIKKRIEDSRPFHTKGKERIGAVGEHFGGIGGVYLLDLKCVARTKNHCTFKDNEGHTFVSSLDGISEVVGTHNTLTFQVVGHNVFAGRRITIIA